MTEEAICKWIPMIENEWPGGWMEVEPLIRCKDCARNDNCFMYRESGNGDGFCAWAEREVE